MPLQNYTSENSARPCLATQFLQILIPTTFKNVCPNQHLKQFCTTIFGDSVSSNPYTNYIQLPFSVKTSYLQFSHVLDDDFLRENKVVSPKI